MFNVEKNMNSMRHHQMNRLGVIDVIATKNYNKYINENFTNNF